MKEIVKRLIKLNKTISTMESCTGGFLANEITNIEGSSEVFKYSAVTYSNEYKIKMGVNKKVIDKYTVYSKETANEMSKNISDFTSSNYGVGITGQINRIDKRNIVNNNNKIYISIYYRDNNKFYNKEVVAIKDNRANNKKYIIEIIKKELLKFIK